MPGIYSNLESDPNLQRNLLRLNAKQTMGGGRSVNRDGHPLLRPGARGGAYQATLEAASQRGARADKFAQLGMAKKRSDLVHRGRMAGHRADKIALKNRKQQMPWTIGIGGGTALLSMLDARSRRAAHAKEQQLETDRYNALVAYQNRGGAV